MAIGEVFLSAFLQVLFDRLAPREFFKFVRAEGIEKKLRKCKNILSANQAVLPDAEERQVTESAVKEWLHDLRDLAYDLDDVMDELTIEAALRSRSSKEASQASSSGSMIPTWVSNFNPENLIFGGDMDFGSKIDRITEELEDLREQINFLSLTRHVGWPKTAAAVERSPTTSVVGELFHVYGRKEDEAAILNLLCLDEPCSGDIQEVRIIPIVGMGGIGKTTLAQLVYNHPRVTNYFDLKAWVCVSDDFNLLRTSRAIFQSVTRQNGDSKELDLIQVQLKEELSNKKFFLVLDDVWNENYLKWDELSRPFRFGLPGSTIIVTTRSKIVASTMGGSASHHYLKELELHDGMSLLAQHALGTTNFDANHLELKAIGEDIVQKCKGLPLAIKALGGLLRVKLGRPEEWGGVLHSNIWDFSDRGLPQALLVSYHHLPPLLKDLFAYTALFPKDCVFDKDGLIFLWMAQGLLPKPANTREHVEEFGCRCFKDLFDRSFFQSLNNDESIFVMHDLMNDLARIVAGETFLGLESKVYEISEKARAVRHFLYVPQGFEVTRKYANFSKIQTRLRTFLSLPPDQDTNYCLSNRVLHDALPNLSCLRVLSLACYSISEIPDSIGNLRHLRYLDFSKTHIKCLPDSVSSLYNLQTLLLRGCEYLRKLPSDMENFVNLQHLDIAGTSILKEMPSGIEKLTSLRTLSKFIVSKRGGGGLGLGELGHLCLLRGSLLIIGLENVMGVSEATKANLNNKHGIDELVLQWSKNRNISNNGSVELDVLNNLRPPTELKKLEIDSYGGLKFPSWLGDPSFKQIVVVKLTNCEKCTSLPPLGRLPKLKKVEIKGMRGVKSIGAEFYYLERGVLLESHIFFPSIETLRIEDMPEWEVWSLPVIASDGGGNTSDDGQFAHLCEFSMKGCPKLVVVPPRLSLSSLVELTLAGCDGVILKSFVDLTSLTDLSIVDIKGLCHLFEEEEDSLQLLSAPLEELNISNCSELVSLGEEEQGLPSNTKKLSIIDCVSLEKLPTRMSSLEKLEIGRCPKLMKTPQGLLKLRSLTIRDCAALESLSNEVSQLQNLSSLEELMTVRCPKLVCFPKTPQGLPKLRSLEVTVCAALEGITDYMPSLETLYITRVDNSGGLLSSLSNFSSLTSLRIDNCDDLESFPNGGKCLPTNLGTLNIFNCWNLKCMPRDIQSLTSLTLAGLSQVDFPEGGLPPNLHYLFIYNCKIVKPLSEWGLHRLTFLQTLWIEGGYEYPKLLMEPIPPIGGIGTIGAGEERGDINYSLLPPSLTTLTINEFRNLESLSEGLQNLTSLRSLWIYNCPKLQSLPHKDVLSNLQNLLIRDCPLLTRRCLNKRKIRTKMLLETTGQSLFIFPLCA